MKKDSGRFWQYFKVLLAKRVLEARENQTRVAGRAAKMNLESSKNLLKRNNQLLQKPFCFGDVQVEIPVVLSDGADKSNCASTSPKRCWE